MYDEEKSLIDPLLEKCPSYQLITPKKVCQKDSSNKNLLIVSVN
jgi:hypothetical protein